MTHLEKAMMILKQCFSSSHVPLHHDDHHEAGSDDDEDDLGEDNGNDIEEDESSIGDDGDLERDVESVRNIVGRSACFRRTRTPSGRTASLPSIIINNIFVPINQLDHFCCQNIVLTFVRLVEPYAAGLFAAAGRITGPYLNNN